MKLKNVMSIDVEEWYHPEAMRTAVPPDRWIEQPSHIERQMETLLALLEEADTRATFFVLGQVARTAPALVRRIAEAGHEVASHGDGHLMITELEPEAFRRDLIDARTALEDASGQEVLGYRAPTFSVVKRTLWALDVMAETGLRYDASIYPIHHDRYGIPDAPRFPYRLPNGMAELPGSTVRVWGLGSGGNFPVGGGGYLRLLPLGFNIAALSYINRIERQPFVVYLHPWETDPAQPRMKLPFPRVFRHYHNVDVMIDRLRTLLARFSFGTARDVLNERGLLAPSNL
jgi:polysaccharide deacetylase family protein (PEP-CTERM system associated)